LGPLLFVVYIADLESRARRHGVEAYFYADNSPMYRPSANIPRSLLEVSPSWQTSTATEHGS